MSLWLKALAISTLALFAPIKAMVIAVFVLVTLDLITGLIRARKQSQPLQSAQFRRTVTKLASYELSIVLAFICETWLTGDLLPLTKLASGAVGLVELLSILENLNVISGGSLRPLLEKLTPAGDKGDKGDRGDRGFTGPRGPQGPQAKLPPPAALAPVVLEVLKAVPAEKIVAAIVSEPNGPKGDSGGGKS